MSAEITIYTDGSCKVNPGPGGWAAILIDDLHKKEISGRTDFTTNNRMELVAAISALKALKKPSAVCIMTDSAYVKNGITKWVKAWKEKGWKTANKQEVKNRDLWEELNTLCSVHTVRWRWVRAHDGNSYNERCDELAYGQASGC